MPETSGVEAVAPTQQDQRAQRKRENLVIAAVLAAAVVVVAGVSLWSRTWAVPDYLYSPDELWPFLLFILITLMSEIVYVPLVHRRGTEELTFFEIIVVVGVLIFAPALAIILPLIGFVLAQTLLRRQFRKTLFNLASYALASSALVAIYASQAAHVERFGLQWLLLLLVGSLAFAGINLVLLGIILREAEGLSFTDFVKEQFSLSIIMVLLSLAAAVTAVELWVSAPALVLLPLTFVFGLWYSYKAYAARNAANLRGASLLSLGNRLSQFSPEQTVDSWRLMAVRELRNIFEAPVAALLTRDQAWVSAQGGEERTITDGDFNQIVETASHTATPLEKSQLAQLGWAEGYLVRVDIESEQDSTSAGAFVIGTDRDLTGVARLLPYSDSKGRLKQWRLPSLELPTLAGLVASLSNALRARDYLARLSDETEKLNAVVESATDGIVVIDTSNEVQMWSPAMERITGFDATSADLPDAANNIRDQVVGLAREARMPLSEQENAQVGFEHALGIVREDGESRELSVSVVPIALPGVGASNDEEIMSVLTIRDMTRERRIERMKSDFIATVSHELKTPITPIRGYSQHLLTKWDRLEPEKRERMLQTMVERTDHLSRLVEDLLIASRVSELETTKLDIRSNEIQLSDIVNDVSAASPDLADRLSVSGPDAQVFCDRQRAVQCLSNLVSNAKKYSEEDTEIIIRTEALTDSEFATVTVTDHGRGIPAGEVGRVFEQFYRVEDPMTMTTGGTGLGLYISRTLARAMGGDISVESVFGEGSTFRLSLPRTQVNEGETA